MAQDNSPNQVNEFLKGMIQDVDINKIPNNKYVTAWDIKLVDKEGQGYVLTNYDGNQFAFSISQFENKNFVPIGWVTHKDILYILSCSTDDLGTGEVGCFPSPMADGSGGFEAEYKPLKNLIVNSARAELRIDNFKFNRAYMLDVKAKDKYDGSVDLYFADGLNPLRVINSGFDQDGVFNDYTYTEETFETKANLVLSAKTLLTVTNHSVTSGGIFKHGSYVFFFKYSTEDFNDSYFVSEYGPIPIHSGANVVQSVLGGDPSDHSDKKVSFTLAGLDISYKYLKVGYLRWFSDFNGVTTSEFIELNAKFNITGSTMTIVVTGSEGEIALPEVDVMLTKDIDIIPKTITQLQNRLWGANWKRTKTHDDSLARFAKLIKIGYDTLEKGNDQTWSSGLYYEWGQYKDYKNYDYIGYFRGEPYVFGIIAELNDGTMTQAYPLNGVDMFANLTPDYTEDSVDKGNYDGIFRFPNARLLPPVNSNTNVRFLGVKFDAELAFLSIMAANENNWIRFNVRAIYFVRGDRYPTLKAQGLMMNLCHPGVDNTNYPLTQYCSSDNKVLNTGQNATEGSFTYNQRRMNQMAGSTTWGAISQNNDTADWGNTYANKYAPVYRGYMPMSSKLNPTSNGYTINYTSRVFHYPDKYAFYSFDMLFQQVNDVSDFNFIWRVGKTIDPRPGATNDNDGKWSHYGGYGFNQGIHPYYYAHCNAAYVNQTARQCNIDQKMMIGEGGIIKPGISGNLDYINGCDEPYESLDSTWFWTATDLTDPLNDNVTYYNRSVVWAKYLGITLDHVDNSGGILGNEDFNLDIVNIYNGDPTSVDIRNLFSNILSIQFKKISQGISIADVVTAIMADSWENYKTITCWRGDCFVQRTYFKQASWKGSAFLYKVADPAWDDPEHVGGSGVGAWHGHGLIMGWISENAINTAMRSSEGDFVHFPDVDMLPWAYEPISSTSGEAFMLNGGYNKALSTNPFLMKDPTLPEKILQYTARIKYSDAVIPGSYIDAYRTFRMNNYRDFDTNSGEIVKLAVVYDRLVSVQEDAINEHYINERLTTPVSDATTAVLGQGDVLSSSFRKMSNFGSQHAESIIEADSLYGVDWKRNLIWECSLQRSAAGSLFLDAKDISKEQLIEKWMRGLSLSINEGFSNKIYNYKDIVMKGEGVNAGYDLNTGDIFFTFHKRVESL